MKQESTWHRDTPSDMPKNKEGETCVSPSVFYC